MAKEYRGQGIGKTLLENLGAELNDKYKMKLMLSGVGKENTERLISLRALVGKAANHEKALFDEVIKNGECYRLSDMKISGKELLQIGISGRKTGEVLAYLLDEIMKGNVENDFGALWDLSVKLK